VNPKSSTDRANTRSRISSSPAYRLSTTKKGGRSGETTPSYVMEIDGLTVCHLGDLGHVPTQAASGSVGKCSTCSSSPSAGSQPSMPAKAAEIVSLLEPQASSRCIFGAPDLNFKLDASANSSRKWDQSVGRGASLKITRDSLPKETQVVLLEAKTKRMRNEPAPTIDQNGSSARWARSSPRIGEDAERERT